MCIRDRYVIGIIILLFINLSLSSCYSIRETTLEDDKSIKISKIISFENDTIDFKYNQKGFATLTDDSVVSINKNGSIKTFPKSAVKTYYSEKFDTGKTVWTVLGLSLIHI